MEEEDKKEDPKQAARDTTITETPMDTSVIIDSILPVVTTPIDDEHGIAPVNVAFTLQQQQQQQQPIVDMEDVWATSEDIHHYKISIEPIIRKAMMNRRSVHFFRMGPPVELSIHHFPEHFMPT
jgi:hypothetical protein